MVTTLQAESGGIVQSTKWRTSTMSKEITRKMLQMVNVTYILLTYQTTWERKHCWVSNATFVFPEYFIIYRSTQHACTYPSNFVSVQFKISRWRYNENTLFYYIYAYYIIIVLLLRIYTEPFVVWTVLRRILLGLHISTPTGSHPTTAPRQLDTYALTNALAISPTFPWR